jgi:hypothetical protein
MIPTVSRTSRWLTCAAVAAALAGCASHRPTGGWTGASASHGHTPPGGAGDPWGPYIHEAGARFHVPEQWIRAVMRQESGGHQYLNGRPTTSWAGAAGLMQVMPGTYSLLAARYGLGSDPYDPHDNIMAGTAYIREMYDKYGSPGFLAAYNAGPGRMDAHLAGRALPVETVNYMASISPNLGDETPDGGTPAYAAAAPLPPRRAYASAQPAPDLSPIAPSYVEPVPDDTPPAPPVVAAALPPPPPPAPAPGPRSGPVVVAAAPPPMAAAELSPVPRAARPAEYRLVTGKPYATTMLAHGSIAVRPAAGQWAVQVGAYSSPALARVATEGARQGANIIGGETAVTTVKRGNATLYRARLTGLSQSAAHDACTRLRTIGSDCNVIPPDGGA